MSDDDNQLPAAPRKPRGSVLRSRKRDYQIRRFVFALRQTAPHLQEACYGPSLRAYAMLSLSIERCYAKLRDEDPISAKTGEIRNSYDILGRMVSQLTRLSKALNLTPM